jgi:hypothetical protein
MFQNVRFGPYASAALGHFIRPPIAARGCASWVVHLTDFVELERLKGAKEYGVMFKNQKRFCMKGAPMPQNIM